MAAIDPWLDDGLVSGRLCGSYSQDLLQYIVHKLPALHTSRTWRAETNSFTCSTPDDVYKANYFATLDCINNGITTVLDHSHILNSPAHADASIQGLKDAGIRGTWCYAFYQSPDRHDLDGSNHDHTLATPTNFDRKARFEDAKRARERYFQVNDPEKTLLTFGGAPSEAEGMPADELKEEIDFFRSIGTRVITMHIGMGCYDVGNRIVKMLKDGKRLGKDLVFSHGAALTDHELKMIHETGAGVSATSETEIQMGMGPPIAWKAAAAGCNVGIGIDITSNNNNDMLASMRLLLQAERGRRWEPMLGKEVPIDITPKSEEALYMATLGGAKVIGLDHMVGSITPGKRADLLITRCDDMNVVPVINPIGTLMFNAHIGNFDTVMIDGKIVKRGGHVLNVDWPKLRQDIRERAARIVEVAKRDKVVSTAVYWRDVFQH